MTKLDRSVSAAALEVRDRSYERRKASAFAFGTEPLPKGYSLRRHLEQIARGGPVNGLEREISDELARCNGRDHCLGEVVPWAALRDFAARDFTAGTASEAGNLVATGARDSNPPLQPASFMSLGPTVLLNQKGNVVLPRSGVTVAMSWLTEAGLASEINPQSSVVTMSPKRAGGFVDVSREALFNPSGIAERYVRRLLNGAAVAALENAAVNGTGVSPNPRGIRSTSGIGSVAGGTNGAAISWAHVVSLEDAPATANAEGGPTGYLVNTKTRKSLKTTPKGTNLDFCWSSVNTAAPLNGHRAVATNNVPGNLTKGTSSGVCSSVIFSSDWEQLVIALFGPGLDLTVDPFTRAKDGITTFSLNLYADIAVAQPEAFAVMDDALTP